MKTNLLFVAALFFTGTAMSQTVGGSNQSSAHASTTASSTGDQRASAGVKAGSSVKTESEHNKAAANASINNNIDVSTRTHVEYIGNRKS
jgi:hypothetical protein